MGVVGSRLNDMTQSKYLEQHLAHWQEAGHIGTGVHPG